MSKKFSILLGDNPFFGVNHLSQEIAREKAAKSQNFENIQEVMEFCFHSGINKMVVSTHPELKDLIRYLHVNSTLVKDFQFYPIIPYAQGYVTKINEKGPINTLREILNSAGIKEKIRIITKGGLGVLRQDFNDLFRLLIDLELLQLQNVKIKTVFLHDVVTDLALVLNLKKIFQLFGEHIQDKYDVEVGLVTKNFPRLVSRLNEWEINFPYIMTSFNKVGFQMNPSKIECENALSECNSKIIAMSVLAGGYLNLQDAYDYILKFDQINSLVIGISSKDHAKSTLECFQKNTSS